MNTDTSGSLLNEEQSILGQLDRAVRSDTVRQRIDCIVRRVEERMREDRTRLMAWEPIPLSVYGEALPAMIRSSWVFILRAGAATGPERHPNSHQRMMSYRESGDLQTGGEGRWESHLLVSEATAGLEGRWVSVPPNVWHQAVVPGHDWVVVSFHTVGADELAGVMLVAEREGTVVATGALAGCEILGVFVDPPYQGCGYGKAVMRALEERARGMACEQVELSVSLPSKAFYESLEYRMIEECSIAVGEGECLRFWKAKKPLGTDRGH